MFGSNSFGQSSTTPSRSRPAFGRSTPTVEDESSGSSVLSQISSLGGVGYTDTQTSPFRGSFLHPQPHMFGSSTPFGAPSRPAFSAQTTPALGASTTPAFGAQTTSAFGAQTTPAFGAQTTSAFGAQTTSAFGAQTTSAFGAQTTPAFGASTTPAFGASTTPAFGPQTTSAFGPQTTSAFGAQTTSAFGAQTTSAFGASTTPAFGAPTTPAFGAQTTSAFGVSTSPAFGAQTTPAFGGSTTTAFGSSTVNPTFGASASSAFGAPSTPAFGAQTAPSFNIGLTPTFSQSTSTFGNTPFPASSFGAQTPSFGAQTTNQPAGKIESISAMPVYRYKSHEELRWGDYQLGDKGGHRGGSRVSPYSPTPDADGSTSTQQHRWGDYQLGDKGGHRWGSRLSPYSPTPDVDDTSSSQPAGKVKSISTMPVYENKSHEELRWEDYQLGDKGGQRRGSRVSPYSPTPEAAGATGAQPDGKIESILAMPVYEYKSHEELRWEDYQLGDKGGFRGFDYTGFPSPAFGTSNTSNLFGSTLSATPSLFRNSTQAALSFGSPSSAQASTSAFGSSLRFGNTRSSPLFQSSTPTLTETSPPFGQTVPVLSASTPTLTETTTPSTGFANILSTTPSLPNTNNALGLAQTTSTLSAQPSTSFGSFNTGRSESASTSDARDTPRPSSINLMILQFIAVLYIPQY